MALFLRHAGMEHHLQQKIAQLVLQICQIAALDGVDHLIGFLDRIGCDRGVGLFEIPGAARARRAQRRHDLQQVVDVTGRRHGGGFQETGHRVGWSRAPGSAAKKDRAQKKRAANWSPPSKQCWPVDQPSAIDTASRPFGVSTTRIWTSWPSASA